MSVPYEVVGTVWDRLQRRTERQMKAGYYGVYELWRHSVKVRVGHQVERHVWDQVKEAARRL